MIQQEYKNDVKGMSDEVTTSGFTVEVNESMFQMLTSNVYNDPILAVMREWSTNACDACIVAEKPVLFNVHIPTLSERYFSVRDYGTGLHPEDIVGLFSKLGASTKRSSNKLNGTFGIGRMAGLAVSNAFTVESFYKGTHYSYAISVSNGVPSTMNLGSQPTTEPDGLKLSVSVDADDIPSYVTRAPELYKYFDHKPKLNLENINIELDTSTHMADTWFIKNDSGYRQNNFVVMSQVVYTIPWDDRVKDLGFRGLVIKADPGAVTFNPGRETLSLNRETVEYLNNAFITIKAEYVLMATLAIAEGTTDKEVLDAYMLFKDAPSEITSLITPEPFFSTLMKDMYDGLTWRSSKHFMNVTASEAFDTRFSSNLVIAYKSSYYKQAKTLTPSNPMTTRDFFNALHVIVDVKTNYRKAFDYKYSNRSVVYWQRVKGGDLDVAVTQAKEALATLGVDYKLASTVVEDFLKEVPPETAATLERAKGFYASTIGALGAVVKSSLLTPDETTSRDYLYVKLSNTTPELTSTTHNLRTFCCTAAKLRRMGIEIPKIMGVPKKYQEVVKDLSNWMDLETYITEVLTTTTFNVKNVEEIKSLHSRYMDKSTRADFPESIRDYYDELSAYHNFIADPSTLEEGSIKSLAETAGSILKRYTPTKDVDLAYLEEVFPVTLGFLQYQTTSYDMVSSTVAHIAKLEESYALHTSKRQ